MPISNQSRAVAWPSAVVVRWMRDRVSAAGANPEDIPEILPARFLRPREVRQLIGVSTSTLYRMIGDGAFRRPIPIDRAASRQAA
jgi:predicted DNA-binding transcriptional regulator AlpA